MKSTTKKSHYRPTESKYKGGATDMYVTYDLPQRTRGGGKSMYPKVKRVYIAGDVDDWKTGTFTKKSGRAVHGVQIEFDQSRSGYRRREFTATRGKTRYDVSPASVGPTSQRFSQVVEVPKKARNVHFYQSGSRLPAKYRQALQDVK